MIKICRDNKGIANEGVIIFNVNTCLTEEIIQKELLKLKENDLENVSLNIKKSNNDNKNLLFI